MMHILDLHCLQSIILSVSDDSFFCQESFVVNRSNKVVNRKYPSISANVNFC